MTAPVARAWTALEGVPGGRVCSVEGKLADPEVQRLFDFEPDIFGLEDHDVVWIPKDLRFLLEVGGELMSHVGLVKRELQVGGGSVVVAGVGAVVTHRAGRHRGYATAMMRLAQRYMMEEWRVTHGMLFCRDALVGFYARLGWAEIADEVEVEQPAGKVVLPFRVMSISREGEAWPAGRVDLCGLPW